MVFATENDVLNGLGMLFMELLTNRAQIFADVRTFWSPEATKRATGYEFEDKAKENGGIIHLLNSGAACLDACGECTDENGNKVMKRWWEVTNEDIKKMTDATYGARLALTTSAAAASPATLSPVRKCPSP